MNTIGIPAHYIKDEKGKFYPYAHVNAIFDNEGNLLKDSPLTNKFREFESFSKFPTTGEVGIAYIDSTNNILYRWDSKDSKYCIVGSPLELGVKSTNAGRGDWTKIAYDHSQSSHAPTSAQENIIENITLGGVQQAIENKTIVLPKYPTTLPASDVPAWAKASTKPSYTKSEIGLGNVPNVTTNDQSPTFTTPTILSNIISGEKLSIMLGKIAKAMADFITHKADTTVHITAAERTNWNDADSKKHTHSNKAVIDKITQTLLDNWSAAYSHVSDTVKHITAAERSNWNTVTSKVDKVTGKGLSTNDYTTAERNKLTGIAPGAEVNVQGDWNIIDENSDAYIKNKPDTFPPSPHNHTKAQITDMPTKVSQLTNDAGYITQSDVDTSQNHTHSNKTVLDKITQALLDTWNGKAGTSVATQAANGLMAAADKKKLDGVAVNANNYVHLTTAGNKHIPAGGASGQFLKWSADGTAIWASDNNTTYSAFKAATASVAGEAGLVPAPAAGTQAKYLRADGTWQTPTNTTYSDMKGATASVAGTHGLVPAPAAGAQTKYLRADGSWQTPPDTNTTYGAASTSAAGLMSAADKSKLNGIATGAEVNVQSDWNITDVASDAFIKNKPSSMPASDVPAWAKATNKPSYGWSEITGKPTTFPPSTHTHLYAGSSSSGGSATSAIKFATARKIGNANFDGTNDITLAQIGAATTTQFNQLQQVVDRIVASDSIDGGDLMDSEPSENSYDGGTL